MLDCESAPISPISTQGRSPATNEATLLPQRARWVRRKHRPHCSGDDKSPRETRSGNTRPPEPVRPQVLFKLAGAARDIGLSRFLEPIVRTGTDAIGGSVSEACRSNRRLLPRQLEGAFSFVNDATDGGERERRNGRGDVEQGYRAAGTNELRGPVRSERSATARTKPGRRRHAGCEPSLSGGILFYF